MRALTLTQPWCGLVASGIKQVENRDRSLIRREDLGQPFALHASREIKAAVYRTIWSISPVLFSSGDPPVDTTWYRLSRIVSAVLAVAVIERAVTWEGNDPRSKVIVDFHTRERVDLGDQVCWFFGVIGYVLRGPPIILPRPVYGGGNRGFWTLSAGVAARVEEQLTSTDQIAVQEGIQSR